MDAEPQDLACPRLLLFRSEVSRGKSADQGHIQSPIRAKADAIGYLATALTYSGIGQGVTSACFRQLYAVFPLQIVV